MKKFLGVLCVVALVLTGACGRFGSSESPSETTLLGEGDGVGAGLTTPTTSPPPSTTAKPVAAATTAPAPKCPYNDPTSEIVYGNRIRMTLTVTPLCPQHADDISFTLKVTNVSSDTVHYDKNQQHFFSLLAYPQGTGRIRWEDTNCQPRTGNGSAPAGNLAPGESITIGGLYPALKSAGGDREKCRRLEKGGYSGEAVFLVCDGAAYTDGYCNLSEDAQFKAQRVLINVES